MAKKKKDHQDYLREKEEERLLKEELLKKNNEEAEREKRKAEKLAFERQKIEKLKQESLVEQAAYLLNTGREKKEMSKESNMNQKTKDTDRSKQTAENHVDQSAINSMPGCSENECWDDIWDENYTSITDVTSNDIWDESEDNLMCQKQQTQHSKRQNEQDSVSSSSNSVQPKFKQHGPNNSKGNLRQNEYYQQSKQKSRYHPKNNDENYKKNTTLSETKSVWDFPNKHFQKAGVVEAPEPEVNIWQERKTKMEILEEMLPHNDREEEAMLRQALELSRRQAAEDHKRRIQLEEEYELQMKILTNNPNIFEEISNVDDSSNFSIIENSETWTASEINHNPSPTSYKKNALPQSNDNKQSFHYGGARPKHNQPENYFEEFWDTDNTTNEARAETDCSRDNEGWGSVPEENKMQGTYSEEIWDDGSPASVAYNKISNSHNEEAWSSVLEESETYKKHAEDIWKSNKPDTINHVTSSFKHEKDGKNAVFSAVKPEKYFPESQEKVCVSGERHSDLKDDCCRKEGSDLFTTALKSDAEKCFPENTCKESEVGWDFDETPEQQLNPYKVDFYEKCNDKILDKDASMNNTGCLSFEDHFKESLCVRETNKNLHLKAEINVNKAIDKKSCNYEENNNEYIITNDLEYETKINDSINVNKKISETDILTKAFEVENCNRKEIYTQNSSNLKTLYGNVSTSFDEQINLHKSSAEFSCSEIHQNNSKVSNDFDFDPDVSVKDISNASESATKNAMSAVEEWVTASTKSNVISKHYDADEDILDGQDQNSNSGSDITGSVSHKLTCQKKLKKNTEIDPNSSFEAILDKYKKENEKLRNLLNQKVETVEPKTEVPHLSFPDAQSCSIPNHSIKNSSEVNSDVPYMPLQPSTNIPPYVPTDPSLLLPCGIPGNGAIMSPIMWQQMLMCSNPFFMQQLYALQMYHAPLNVPPAATFCGLSNTLPVLPQQNSVTNFIFNSHLQRNFQNAANISSMPSIPTGSPFTNSALFDNFNSTLASQKPLLEPQTDVFDDADKFHNIPSEFPSVNQANFESSSVVESELASYASPKTSESPCEHLPNSFPFSNVNGPKSDIEYSNVLSSSKPAVTTSHELDFESHRQPKHKIDDIYPFSIQSETQNDTSIPWKLKPDTFEYEHSLSSDVIHNHEKFSSDFAGREVNVDLKLSDVSGIQNVSKTIDKTETYYESEGWGDIPVTQSPKTNKKKFHSGWSDSDDDEQGKSEFSRHTFPGDTDMQDVPNNQFKQSSINKHVTSSNSLWQAEKNCELHTESRKQEKLGRGRSFRGRTQQNSKFQQQTMRPNRYRSNC